MSGKLTFAALGSKRADLAAEACAVVLDMTRQLAPVHLGTHRLAQPTMARRYSRPDEYQFTFCLYTYIHR